MALWPECNFGDCAPMASLCISTRPPDSALETVQELCKQASNVHVDASKSSEGSHTPPPHLGQFLLEKPVTNSDLATQ